jgi:hypothetical protein
MFRITPNQTRIAGKSIGNQKVLRWNKRLSQFWAEMLQSIGCLVVAVFDLAQKVLSRISLEVGICGTAFRLAGWGDWDTMNVSRLPPWLFVVRRK